MLHLSSCLFGTTVLHAYYIQNTLYHHIFLLLTISSILFHTTHCEITRIIDKLLAHFSFLLILMDTPVVLSQHVEWLLLFPFTAACFWFGQSVFPDRKNDLHLCLHLISVIGVHVYLYVLYARAYDQSAMGMS